MFAKEPCQDTPATPSRSSLRAGTLLHDRFIVVAPIAATGLSQVYRGYDRRSGQPVAIKQLSNAARPGGLARASAIRGLVREAALLGAIRHQQIPQFLALFCQHGSYYLVTAYVTGSSLADLLEHGLVTQEQRWQIAASLCNAVSALHSQTPPIIHGDIKPNNIIVGTRGQVTLIDLGLSRRRNTPAAFSEVMGTPPYAPPEQWAGELLDERSDVYALGKVLEDLFAGSAGTALNRILARASAPAPDARFASASRLHDALEVIQQIERESRSPVPWLICDRWTLLGLLAILMVAGVLLLR